MPLGVDEPFVPLDSVDPNSPPPALPVEPQPIAPALPSAAWVVVRLTSRLCQPVGDRGGLSDARPLPSAKLCIDIQQTKQRTN
jgi:hypothetical protein